MLLKEKHQGGRGNSVTTDTWSQPRPWASSSCSCKTTRTQSILHHSWHLPNVYKSHSSWVGGGTSVVPFASMMIVVTASTRLYFLPSCSKCSSRKFSFSQTRRKSCNLEFRVNWRCRIYINYRCQIWEIGYGRHTQVTPGLRKAQFSKSRLVERQRSPGKASSNAAGF